MHANPTTTQNRAGAGVARAFAACAVPASMRLWSYATVLGVIDHKARPGGIV